MTNHLMPLQFPDGVINHGYNSDCYPKPKDNEYNPQTISSWLSGIKHFSSHRAIQFAWDVGPNSMHFGAAATARLILGSATCCRQNRRLYLSSSFPLPNSPQLTRSIMTKVRRITDDLERPSLDDRLYRVIELPNKLEALLVHDPETDKASASMNVGVGSYSDDNDMPGMAHAVEHLLFMGTKKV
jgi:Insulinase (Peptidase family M16)